MEAPLEVTRCKVAKTTHARTWVASKAAPARATSLIVAGPVPEIAVASAQWIPIAAALTAEIAAEPVPEPVTYKTGVAPAMPTAAELIGWAIVPFPTLRVLTTAAHLAELEAA
jgi:hypothetical protein